MLGRLIGWLDRTIGIAILTSSDGILLKQRFAALQRQVPWLYAILLANLLGLQITLADEPSIPLIPTLVMCAIIVVRGSRWVRIRGEQLLLNEIQREMRRTFLLASLFCAAFAIWSCWLFASVGADHLIEIVLLTGLAGVGCTYAMTGFPGGARVPLVILLMPLIAMLLLTGEPANIGIAVSMTIVSGVTLRLLNVHDDAFVGLVRSNIQIAAEQKRAVEAERLAIQEQSRVQLLANSDALTGLTNRRGFLASFDHLSSEDKAGLALILIDLDGFKPINDTFGHASGDALLVSVSRRLQSLPLRGILVARLGGDEFAMVCKCESAAEAYAAATEAVASLHIPFSIDGRTLSVAACAGVSFQGEDNLSEGMRRADIALYRSKDCGRGHVTLFTEDMERDVQRKRSIEQALREPGIDSEIDVAFQPIFKLDSMEISSFEALARWSHSELGWISPAEFIPITEQISVLESMSEALLRRAANAAHNWPRHIRLSFNLSAVQLCASGTADRILSVLDDQDFDARRLQIEVTETALLADFDVARENISALRERGVSIVLDDFGAGYSSINYLRQIHFEAVKLDGSLLTGADKAGGLPLLRVVLALCRAIGLPCVAEHIESQQQLDQLRRLGCQFGQGYLLSPPLAAHEAAVLAGARFGSARNRAA